MSGHIFHTCIACNDKMHCTPTGEFLNRLGLKSEIAYEATKRVECWIQQDKSHYSV